MLMHLCFSWCFPLLKTVYLIGHRDTSLLDLLFVKFPNLTSPITIQTPLGKSDHALLQWTYTSAVAQPPPLPSKVNPARTNVQSLTSLTLECNWEFPEKSSLNGLWISFRDQISLLTSKATPPLKNRKHSLKTLLYASSKTRNPTKPRSLDYLEKF